MSLLILQRFFKNVEISSEHINVFGHHIELRRGYFVLVLLCERLEHLLQSFKSLLSLFELVINLAFKDYSVFVIVPMQLNHILSLFEHLLA